MSAKRFFVEGVHAAGDTVTLAGSDARKILTVLRKRSGDHLEIVDSAAVLFDAELDTDGNRVAVRLLQRLPSGQAFGPQITIAQGIPKGQKMDFVVEKLTELGVAAIVPLESERSVVTGVGFSKLDRWRRLAKSSAQQCGRRDVPEIAAPADFEAVLRSFGSFDCVLLPWELAPPESGAAGLRIAALVRGKKNVLAIIGPEGGFSHQEVSAAREAGAHVVSLGDRILRAETAGLVLAALVQFS